MGKKQGGRQAVGRKIDVRNVMIDEDMDPQIDEYILRQKKLKRRLKRGEAVVELARKGLEVEGIA